MDKLISANSLYKKLSTNSKGERIPEQDVDNFPITLTLREIKKIIMDEPAAFDKEKVVKELKQQVEQYRRRGKEFEEKGSYSLGEKMIAKAYSYEHALEIVEKGGVD